MEDKKLKRREWEKWLIKEHLAVSENSADGNCFFESIAKILYGDEQYHICERKKNCNWVKTRIESLKVNPITRIPPNECKTIEELLDQLLSLNIDGEDEKIDTVEMCKNYTYAGLHQILATCIIYKEQKLIIQVFHEFANDVTRTTYSTLSKEEVQKEIKEERANIIYLHYSTMQYRFGHYQAIVDADIAIKKTQTQETLDELLHQFPQVNRGVITQLHDFGYQIKDIKKVFEEGDALGKDIGYIMDKISTIQKESSPKGPIKASSQSRSNSPNNITIKASSRTRSKSPKDTRKASTVRSNSPKGTITAAADATSSSKYKFNFSRNDPEQTSTSSKKGPTPQGQPKSPKSSNPWTRDEVDPFPRYTEAEQDAAVAAVMKQMKEIEKNRSRKKKGGNKTKKRGRRYRSFRRT